MIPNIKLVKNNYDVYCNKLYLDTYIKYGYFYIIYDHFVCKYYSNVKK